MRVLTVIHDYLPLHAAGSEIYAASVCRALKAAGHEVAVFTCEERRDLEQWSLTRRVHDDVPVFEAIYNRIYHDLSEQWDDLRMAAVFAGVVDQWRPDLVHVHGLQFVGGTSSLQILAERGIPTVMTLHEYWWLCPRSGLMYDPDGRACETATPVDCARCVDVYPIDRDRWSDERSDHSHADLGDRRWFARALEGRAADMAAAVAHVDRFIAPSHFLAERFGGAGFPREKLVVADYGFPPAPVIPLRPLRRPIHFGFVGTLSDYKGVEVFARAVAATGRSSDELVASIHGHLDWFPEIAATLRQLADDCPLLELAGPFDPSERDRVMGALDVLVVPSLWWENSPLTIHEAHQRGIPVLASDRGGMAELLAAGGGHTFPPGDSDALAALICELVDEPEQIDILRRAIPPVKPIEDDVKLLEELHAEITAAR